MRHLWRLLRLVHINHVLLKHGLDEIILATHLLRPLRFLLPLAPWRWFHKSTLPRGVRIRLVLEELVVVQVVTPACSRWKRTMPTQLRTFSLEGPELVQHASYWTIDGGVIEVLHGVSWE